MHDELYLPYLEPRVLHHGEAIHASLGPHFEREGPSKYFKLAHKWERHGLLGFTQQPPPQSACTQIFNVFKSSEELTGKIRDRRLANQLEYHTRGPSRFLPGGYLSPTFMFLQAGVSMAESLIAKTFITRVRQAQNELIAMCSLFIVTRRSLRAPQH